MRKSRKVQTSKTREKQDQFETTNELKQKDHINKTKNPDNGTKQITQVNKNNNYSKLSTERDKKPIKCAHIAF